MKPASLGIEAYIIFFHIFLEKILTSNLRDEY